MKKEFIKLWTERIEVWSKRLDISKNLPEYETLKSFLESYNNEDVKSYLYDKQTNLTESFHNLATKYCPNHSPFSYEVYKMCKSLDVLDLEWKSREGGEDIWIP